MNKNPSRGIYIPTTSKVHPIYEKGHPYYKNVHPLYEKRTSQLRVKYILTTSKEAWKCKFFILGGLLLLYALYFSITAEEDIYISPLNSIFAPMFPFNCEHEWGNKNASLEKKLFLWYTFCHIHWFFVSITQTTKMQLWRKTNFPWYALYTGQ